VPLRLVTGPANSAKAGRILGGYREALRAGLEPILVVPAFRDVAHSQRELAAGGAVFGTRVMRFAWLFELVAERCGSEALRTERASRLQRELLVAHAVRSAPLDALRRSAERPGFARAAARFIGELERAMIEPQRLAQGLRDWAGEGPRARFAAELPAIYRGYRAALEAAGLVDDELYGWRALEALAARPGDWGRTPVFFYGFDDFTPIELALIEALAGPAEAGVAVSLPYEEGRVAFEAIEPLVRRLRAIADEHEALPESDAHYDPGSRDALHRVERRLWEPDDGAGAGVADPAASVRLLSAGGERAEVELAGAEILALLRAGMAPGDVALVMRRPADYGSLVEQVFTAYGIPFALERAVPFVHTGLGRGVLALLACASGEGTADDLLTYLRTAGRLDQPRLADRLEAEARRRGLRTAAEARELWESERWPLGEIDRLARARTTAALAAQLDEEAERLFARPYRRLAPVFTDAEREDPRALQVLRGALAGVRRLAATDPAWVPEPAGLRELLAGLEVYAGAAPAPDRVQVASPLEIRARRFEAVFVCGLQEGEFPRTPRPDPILSDDDRRSLAAATGLVLPLREERPARERHLFYVCASRPERLLALSWRETDEEGAPQVRSFLVDDVRALFPGALDEPAAARSLAQVAWDPDAAPTPVEWERAVALAGPRRSPPGPERLTCDAVLADLRARDRLSASALEYYADCPVKWLIGREVDPEALEPDPEPMVRGRYAHAVLEQTYRSLGGPVTPGNLERAERILIDALRERESDFRISPRATRVRAAVRRLEVDLLQHLRSEAAAGGDFEPAELELDFGMGELGSPPLEVGDGLAIRGRIDRVDSWNGYALVRDYKGGRNVDGVAKWEDGNRLQVALYMLAVREVLGLEPAGGVYVPLAGDHRPRGVLRDDLRDQLPRAGTGGGGLYDNDLVPAERLEAELARARERVLELAGRMRSGDVRPCPETCAWNGGCSYPSICRVER
jgi:ATP-dependent helicase/DNAse subunit B